MDSRLHVAQALGLALGDAHILRNAGGRVTEDMIRSLVISQQQMGTREIVVLHHTDCGAQTFENGPFQEYLKEELGYRCVRPGLLALPRYRGECTRGYATPYRVSPNTR